MPAFLRALLLAGGLALAGFARGEVIDIDNGELARLTQNGVPVIDIRLPAEWEATGIIAGSRLATFFDERGQSDPAAWLKKIKPYAKPDRPVIVVCRTGRRSLAVSNFLSREAGYATVYNLKAGITGWIEDKRPVAPAAPAIAACRSAGGC